MPLLVHRLKAATQFFAHRACRHILPEPRGTGEPGCANWSKTIGHKIYEQENPRFIKKEHLIKTRHFYEKYGAATIIIARFVPIIRTFAPFVAGVGEMHYTKFISYNVIGGLLWAFIFILGGYYFGNLPMVQQNFSLVVMAIIIISVMPVIIGFIKERRKPNNSEA